MPIVEAVLASSCNDPFGTVLGKTRLSTAIETAMVEAIKKAHAEGVMDPTAIKARMMAAREAVKTASQVEPKENGEGNELES